MSIVSERQKIIISGLIIGAIAGFLVLAGNPQNMGFCIACFIRDSVGGLGLHRAAPVQYIRPEIIGLVLGAFILSWVRGERSAKGGVSTGNALYFRLFYYDWLPYFLRMSIPYDIAFGWW